MTFRGALVWMGFLTFASPLFAATIRVPEDSPSILAALDLAVDGDSVVVGPGTWTDRATRGLDTACGFLKGGVTLFARDGPEDTTIDAGGSTNLQATGILFLNFPGKSSSVEGFTITSPGRHGGCVEAWNAKRITVRSCRLIGGEFDPQGNALDADTVELVLEDSEVSFNSGSGSSVGVSVYQSNATIRRCRFEGNRGLSLLAGSSTGGHIGLVEDCVFINNSNPNLGPGAAQVQYAASATVQRCLFQGNSHVGQVGNVGALLVSSLSLASVSFNTFAYDSAIGGAFSFPGGLTVIDSPLAEIRNNTFYRCYADADPYYGGACFTAGGFSPVGTTTILENNVFAESQGSSAISLSADFPSELPYIHSCNVFWGNALGDYSPSSFPLDPVVADISADPLFCNPEYEDWSVRANSPCAPGASPGCGAIGAWPVGCGAVSVESKSWGQIKGMYR